MNAPIQKGAGSQHHRPGAKGNAHLGDGACHPVAFDHQISDCLLKELQMGLVFQHAANGGLVQQAVCLRTGRTHGGPLAAVENAELDAGFVRGQSHGPTQCIHLLDQMPLADATDAGIAAHLPQRLDVVGQQQGAAPHARRGQGRFGPRMASTDHDDVKLLRIDHG